MSNQTENVEIIRLRELGCKHAQGYFFSRPVHPDTAARFLDGTNIYSPSRSGNRKQVHIKMQNEKGVIIDALSNNGEPDRDRTCDPLIKSQLLYQLSYRPVKRRELYVAEMKCQAQSKARTFHWHICPAMLRRR